MSVSHQQYSGSKVKIYYLVVNKVYVNIVSYDNIYFQYEVEPRTVSCWTLVYLNNISKYYFLSLLLSENENLKIMETKLYNAKNTIS